MGIRSLARLLTISEMTLNDDTVFKGCRIAEKSTISARQTAMT
jgi:hypothetical protein